MQSCLNLIRRCLVFLLLAFCAPVVLPQSHNREAMKWFDAGLAEKNVAQRIEAYSKAIEFDPNFAEALFNLGTTYKEQKSYERAEQFLRRAANTTNHDLRIKALSALASIYNIRGSSKRAESALREAKTLAGEPKQRAVLSYELGRLLYQQGRYEEAVAELQDGRNDDLTKQESFDNLIKLAENFAQLDYWYAAAEKQKAAGHLQEAKTTLEQIKAKNANFRDVQAKLDEIETLLTANTDETVAPADEVKTEIVTPANDINEIETEKTYAEGLLAIRKRDWPGAIAAFEQTLKLSPDNREAQQKLAAARLDLERDAIETIAARYYAEGVAAMNRNDLDSASVALEKVYKINRRYREVATLYAQVESARGGTPTVATTVPRVVLPQASISDTAMVTLNQTADFTPLTVAPAIETRLDSLYQLARGAMARNDWNGAVASLQKLRMLQSGYRDADQLFVEARTNLLEMAQMDNTVSLSRPPLVWLGGLAVVLVAGLLLGFLFFSSVGRARMQRWRGNDNVAALIYESLLARRPSRQKLYSALAEIYLKMNRRDEAALQVYRRVLELNLPSPYRADLNAIVALHTVYEKSTTGEVIARADSFTSEAPSPGSSVLLADGGFQMKEKTPTRRPRKRKAATTPVPEANNGTIENGVMVPGELLMDAAFTAPVKPRKPRKKKAATIASSDTLNGTPLTGDGQQLAASAPVKRPRRKKVTVIDSIHIAETMMEPLEIDDAKAKLNLPSPSTVLPEAVRLALHESAPHEEMAAV